jgi:hypothetical protein
MSLEQHGWGIHAFRPGDDDVSEASGTAVSWPPGPGQGSSKPVTSGIDNP